MRPEGLDVWYGCTGLNIEATIDYCRFAAEHDAHGAIIAAAPYICASEADITEYLIEVAGTR